MKKIELKIKLNVILKKYEFEILKTMLNYVCCNSEIVGTDEYFNLFDKLRKKLLSHSYYI